MFILSRPIANNLISIPPWHPVYSNNLGEQFVLKKNNILLQHLIALISTPVICIQVFKRRYTIATLDSVIQSIPCNGTLAYNVLYIYMLCLQISRLDIGTAKPYMDRFSLYTSFP